MGIPKGLITVSGTLYSKFYANILEAHRKGDEVKIGANAGVP